jgi:hypothetical protein
MSTCALFRDSRQGVAPIQRTTPRNAWLSHSRCRHGAAVGAAVRSRPHAHSSLNDTVVTIRTDTPVTFPRHDARENWAAIAAAFCKHANVQVMLAAAVLLLVGLTLTIRWCRTAYRPWGSAAPHADSAEEIAEEPTSATPSSLQLTTLRYLRGVAVGLVGGFWAGALLTGPAGRLIMRLLAVTAGEDAQGKITEAEEVVGRIDLGGSSASTFSAASCPGY